MYVTSAAEAEALPMDRPHTDYVVSFLSCHYNDRGPFETGSF